MSRPREPGDLPHLRLAKQEGVGLVYLSRPPVNAVNEEVLMSVYTVFSDPQTIFGDIRAIAFLSDLSHFSAGYDRTELDLTLSPEYLKTVTSHIASIRHCSVPVVAGVTGAAAGTGFILAAAADIMVVDPAAELWLPEVELGLLGGAGYAARALPPAMVRFHILTGRRVEGTTIARWGGGVLPDPGHSVEETVLQICAVLASYDPDVVSSARSLLEQLDIPASELHATEMRRLSVLLGET